MRVSGARSLSQVRYAILEVTGEFSVFLKHVEPVGEDLLDYIVRVEGRAVPGQSADEAKSASA